MNADIKWLDDPEVFRVNVVPAHSDHPFYTEENVDKNELAQSLNGEWDFWFSKNAKERPLDFYKETFDRTTFDKIAVPGHIELAGYDKIHYINTMYPWEGHFYRRPPYSLTPKTSITDTFSGADYNPVGSYVKTFDLEKGLLNKRIFIRFEGVEEAMYLWINGEFIGYAEDSFTPSEFDLTPYIKEKGNVLAVEVHKRSTAAYLEDQDFFRFFGIFRDVTLFAKPRYHVEDVWVKPVLNEDYKTGKISLALKASGEKNAPLAKGKVQVLLEDKEGKAIFSKELPLAEEMEVKETELGAVHLWDNHNPYLYKLSLKIVDEKNTLIEYVPLQIGFRKIEMKNKVILLNGKRLILNGVNRHEWSCESGRCIGKKEMEFDIDVFLKNNINAVRTCHYPDQIYWYELCDKNGIYVMAETNLETHGSWQKMGGFEPSWNVPGSLPEWKAVVLDRAKNNFETFKNHTSVLFWSLGNESFAGENLAAMNAYFKETDPERLVHYEGVVNHRVFEDRISDMESRMYATPEDIEKYLSDNPKKPFLLCEYMHDMGNSLGGMKSYMDLLDKYEMYHGGFIWDYIDQAILVTDDVTGEKVLRYGGDFDDRPSDYEFSGDGILFADRSAKPALQEVRYYYGQYK